ncbi:hypothetical protein [Deinococcus hopiensis]|uniref:hypothetical protein n=1 Tax=Deinococcus hopiensis TaxID=309885 RepID=UPI00111C88CB|nr:hypothetical protein [Deinococcus hopiensis]
MSFTFNNKTVNNVGTLNSNGEVTARVEASMMALPPSRRLSEWRAQLGERCDISRLFVTRDESYTALTALQFTNGETASEVRAQTDVRQADGTTLTDRRLFFFTLGGGTIRGDVNCPATHEAYAFDVQLRPGWNTVHEISTFGLTLKQRGTVQYVAEPGATYAGRLLVTADNEGDVR